MTRLLLLLLTLSLSTVFIFTPETEPKDYFLFSDQNITLETHLFFFFEHLILVVLGVVVMLSSSQYRTAILVYIGIQVLDTIIYLLAYGNLKFLDLPVTWNFMKIIIFSLAIINEVWKSKR